MTKALCTIFLAIGIILGFLSGQYSGISQMQKEALSQNLAHYNVKNGSWTWGEASVSGILISEDQKAAVVAACRAKGNKAANDPSCILAGE